MNVQIKTPRPASAPRSEELSFVRRCSENEAQQRWSPLHFWSVEGTGDYERDGLIGQRLAVEYLSYIEASDGPNMLTWIVSDMPRELTGIEVSFLELVGLRARAGRGCASRVVAYWDRRKAEAA